VAHNSGELCGWSVTWSAAGNYYYTKTGETARRVWRGAKTSAGAIVGGDSGGSVYIVSGPSIIAKGIISGEATNGSTHVNVFTDIWDAWYAFPGDIN
jgi:hypothetical protein